MTDQAMSPLRRRMMEDILRPRFLQSLFRTTRRIDLALAGCLRGMIESGNMPTNPRRYSTSWVAIASARLPKLLR
jgi:hypothetical protein